MVVALRREEDHVPENKFLFLPAMKYDLKKLIVQSENGERLKYLFFWGHQPSQDGSVTKSCFSQWWEAAVTVDRVSYATSEHWMMAKKAELFGDKEISQQILQVKSPAEAKKLGREIVNFDEAKWLEKRYEIVLHGSYHKFKQHPLLGEFLINTHDRILVEASPVDNIWGIGLPGDNAKSNDPAQWRGLNLLGFALMETRDFLRDNTTPRELIL
jgi:hypothetical protein